MLNDNNNNNNICSDLSGDTQKLAERLDTIGDGGTVDELSLKDGMLVNTITIDDMLVYEEMLPTNQWVEQEDMDQRPCQVCHSCKKNWKKICKVDLLSFCQFVKY